MASVTFAASSPAILVRPTPQTPRPSNSLPTFSGLAPCSSIARVSASSPKAVGLPKFSSKSRISCVAGDVSPEGTTYLIAGAIAIAIVGSAFPLLFSRKDLCPVCDGSGFVRSGARLGGNAGRKDDSRIVCQNCNGLGKINQVDK